MLIHRRDLYPIRSVEMAFDHVDIVLQDGRCISAPLDHLPRFPNQKLSERKRWETLRWWVWQTLAQRRHQALQGKENSSQLVNH